MLPGGLDRVGASPLLPRERGPGRPSVESPRAFGETHVPRRAVHPFELPTSRSHTLVTPKERPLWIVRPFPGNGGRGLITDVDLAPDSVEAARRAHASPPNWRQHASAGNRRSTAQTG